MMAAFHSNSVHFRCCNPSNIDKYQMKLKNEELMLYEDEMCMIKIYIYIYDKKMVTLLSTAYKHINTGRKTYKTYNPITKPQR